MRCSLPLVLGSGSSVPDGDGGDEDGLSNGVASLS